MDTLSKHTLILALKNKQLLQDYIYNVDQDLYTKLLVDLYGNNILEHVPDDVSEATNKDLILLLKTQVSVLNEKLVSETFKKVEYMEKYKETHAELIKKRKRSDKFEDEMMPLIKELTRKKDTATKMNMNYKEQIMRLTIERNEAVRVKEDALRNLSDERSKRVCLRGPYRVLKNSLDPGLNTQPKEIEEAFDTMQEMLKN